MNAHKLFVISLIFIGWNTIQAQEVWSLQQCIDSARIYNKTLQIHRNHISISEQREKEAKANLFPKITANTDYRYYMELPTQLMPLNALNPTTPEGQFRNLQFGVPHNINAHLQLAMPLYNPQVYGAMEQTKIANEMSQLQFQKSEAQVLYDITSLYYNAQVMKHQIEFIDSNLVNTQMLLKNMELLKSQSMATGNDVNKVKLQVELLHTQKDNVYNKYASVLNALKLNLGISAQRNIVVASEIKQALATYNNFDNILDLKIIQTQNKLLNAELNMLNHSTYQPSLHLIASYGITGFGYDQSPHDFLKFYPIAFAGIQLTYPLFNGTITQRKINQKKLEISNNELQTESLYDKNKMEIENATRLRTTTQQAIINTENQIILAQSIYAHTIIQQKQGTAALTEILSADHALREAQQNNLSAVIDYLKADLEIKWLCGQLGVGE